MQFLQDVKSNTATIFLYLVGAGFAVIVGYEIITRQPIDAIALSFVYGSLTFAVNAAGVKTGVDHTNETVNKAALAQFPLTPAGITAQAVEDAKTPVRSNP
jgi:hypothetical protein